MAKAILNGTIFEGLEHSLTSYLGVISDGVGRQKLGSTGQHQKIHGSRLGDQLWDDHLPRTFWDISS